MPEQLEMPDTMEVMRAMQDPAARDAMLDTMPGGEMARSTGPPSVTFSSATWSEPHEVDTEGAMD